MAVWRRQLPSPATSHVRPMSSPCCGGGRRRSLRSPCSARPASSRSGGRRRCFSSRMRGDAGHWSRPGRAGELRRGCAPMSLHCSSSRVMNSVILPYSRSISSMVGTLARLAIPLLTPMWREAEITNNSGFRITHSSFLLLVPNLDRAWHTATELKLSTTQTISFVFLTPRQIKEH